MRRLLQFGNLLYDSKIDQAYVFEAMKFNSKNFGYFLKQKHFYKMVSGRAFNYE